MPSRIDGGGPVVGGAYLSPSERQHLVVTEEQLKRAKDIARKLPSANKQVVENAGQVAVNVSGPNNANHVFVPKAGSIADVDAVMGELAATSLITVDEKARYNDAATEEEKRAIATEYITRAQADIEQSLQALAPEELAKIESQYHVRTFADGQWGNASQAALNVLMTKGTELRDSERVPAPTDGMDETPPPAVPADDRPAGAGAVSEADKYFVSKNNGRQGVVMIEPAKLTELQRLRARVEGGTATDAEVKLWSEVQDKAKKMYVAGFDAKTKPTAAQVAETYFVAGDYDPSLGHPPMILNPEREQSLKLLQSRVDGGVANSEEVALYDAIVKRGEGFGISVKPAAPEPTTAVSDSERSWLREHHGYVDQVMGLYNAKPNALSNADLTLALGMIAAYPGYAKDVPNGWDQSGVTAFRTTLGGMSETEKQQLVEALTAMKTDFPEHILGNDGQAIEYWKGDENQPLATRSQVEQYLNA